MDQEQPTTTYEQKKLEREKKERQKNLGRLQKRLMKWLLFVFGAVAIAAGIFFLISTSKSTAQDFSQTMADEGNKHVPEGTHITYKSNPPTSGDHWPIPLFPKVYDVEKPDSAIVHSLEHGRVWVSYKPSVSEQTKQSLKNLLKGQSGVILTPRAADDTDIALAAWGHLDTFNVPADGTFPKDRILNFIERYLNRGPEYIPAMDGKEY